MKQLSQHYLRTGAMYAFTTTSSLKVFNATFHLVLAYGEKLGQHYRS